MAGGVKEKRKITKIREKLESAWQYDRENRKEAAEDMRFRAGFQWPDAVRREREAAGRPVLTINKLDGLVRQVANDLKQNTPALKVRPEDDESDPILAEIYDGLLRQIQYQSAAGHVYSHAVEGAATCGIGHFRINTRYTDDTTFDQECSIERINNPLSVYWDPAAVLPDRSDANYCFVVEPVPTKTFKELYPEAKEVSVDVASDGDSTFYWSTNDYVLIAEYWEKVPVKKRIGLLEDGQTIDLSEIKPDMMQFMNIIDEREVDTFEVRQSIVTGEEVLNGPHVWAGKYIPIVPIVGTEVPLQKGTVRYGMVRHAREPQQLYNYWRTAAAEAIALAPKAPWLATTAMIQNHKAMWDSANTTNRPYLVFDPDPNAPGGMPKRERPADPPNALWQEGGLASDDLKATTGIHDASVGAKSNETSGKAILARQREGDVSNYHYTDSLELSLKYAGKVLIDLIPKIYDTQRTVRLLNEDDSDNFIQINTVVYSEDGQPVILNDLSAGRFDLRVTIGPSFATKRMEAAESIMQFIQAFPAAGPLAGDIIAKNMDWPGAEELSERLKTMLPPGVAKDEDAPPPPDPMQDPANQMQMAGMAANVAKAEAEAESVHLDNIAKQVQLNLFSNAS